MTETVKYTSMAFPISVRSIEGNPHNIDTPFGRAHIVGAGNVFEEMERYYEALEAIADGEGDARLIAQQALDWAAS